MDEFKQRTCVKVNIENQEKNYPEITYEADPLRFGSGTSDEQLDCVNFLEKAFLYSMVATIFLGVLSVAHITLIKMDSFRQSKIRRVYNSILKNCQFEIIRLNMKN